MNTDENKQPHVGEILKNYIDTHRVYKSSLARKLGIADNTILRYQKSNTLKASVLWDLSCALKHNFIMQLGEQLGIAYETKAEKELKQQLQQLQQNNHDLKKENELLKELFKR